MKARPLNRDYPRAERYESGIAWMGLLALYCFLLSSCAPQIVKDPPRHDQVDKVSSHQVDIPVPPKKPSTHYEGSVKPTSDLPKPLFKSLSPLDTQKVSLSFAREDYQSIFQALARAAGLNLVIDPRVTELLGQNRTLTAEYQKRPVREILDSVCKALDISWEVQHGTIYIVATVKKVFDLDFLGSIRKSRFTVGGDVLGGGTSSQDVLTPLTGSFELSGETTDTVTDIYKNLEDELKTRIADQGTYFLNRQTGTLFVSARPHTLSEFETFIRALKEKYKRQVLIEAKIVEVELNQAHELGIDWRHLEATLSRSPLQTTGTSFTIESNINDEGILYGLHLSQRYNDISTVFRALEEYGKLKILSNPRLKVLNGQSAIISVGQSVSYLKSLEQETTASEGLTSNQVSVELGSIFDGVLFGVTPIIEGNGIVNLHLVPIKSDLVSLEEREFSGGNVYTFPKVNLREASTAVRAHSGELLILGGLIQERKEARTSGLPLLSRLPFVGPVFRHKIERNRRIELVILLKIQVTSLHDK